MVKEHLDLIEEPGPAAGLRSPRQLAGNGPAPDGGEGLSDQFGGLLAQEIPALRGRGLQAQALFAEVLIEEGDEGVRLGPVRGEVGPGEEHQPVPVGSQVNGVGMENIRFGSRAGVDHLAVSQPAIGGAGANLIRRWCVAEEVEEGPAGVDGASPGQPVSPAQKPGQDRGGRHLPGRHRHRAEEARNQQI